MKTITIIALLGLFASCGKEYVEQTVNIEAPQPNPIEIIDPCGKSEFGHDEVILRFSDTQLVVYYKEGSKEYLTELHVGSYITTDKQACKFDVVEIDGKLEIEEVE